MVQTLEAIKGGGGSVKLGTVGTISSLMTRELESTSSTSHAPSSSRHTPLYRSNGNGPLRPRTSMDKASSSVMRTRGQNQRHIPVVEATTPKRQKQKAPLEDVNIGALSKGANRRSPDFSGKTRSHKQSYRIPMLGSENIHLDKTPIREKKPVKKGSNIVDVVDINCGNQADSLSNKLKKLGFSKLSESFM